MVEKLVEEDGELSGEFRLSNEHMTYVQNERKTDVQDAEKKGVFLSMDVLHGKHTKRVRGAEKKGVLSALSSVEDTKEVPEMKHERVECRTNVFQFEKREPIENESVESASEVPS
jgi:hypothetical protein